MGEPPSLTTLLVGRGASTCRRSKMTAPRTRIMSSTSETSSQSGAPKPTCASLSRSRTLTLFRCLCATADQRNSVPEDRATQGPTTNCECHKWLQSGCNRRIPSNVPKSIVRARGLEPPRELPHRDLNPARLPIPPHPLSGTFSHHETSAGENSYCNRGLCGGSPGIRTQNLRVKSPLRCQLRQRPWGEERLIRWDGKPQPVCDALNPCHGCLPCIGASLNPHRANTML